LNPLPLPSGRRCRTVGRRTGNRVVAACSSVSIAIPTDSLTICIASGGFDASRSATSYVAPSTSSATPVTSPRSPDRSPPTNSLIIASSAATAARSPSATTPVTTRDGSDVCDVGRSSLQPRLDSHPLNPDGEFLHIDVRGSGMLQRPTVARQYTVAVPMTPPIVTTAIFL